MVRHKEKRVVRDSRENVVITYSNIATGKIVSIDKDKFVVKSSVDKQDKGLVEIMHVIERNPKDYSYFQLPDIKYDVLLKYEDKDAKFGKHEDAYDNLPAQIITRSGKLLYRKNIIG